MISDKKCRPIYLKSETIITANAFCIGLISKNRIAMENLLTNLKNWTLISQFSTKEASKAMKHGLFRLQSSNLRIEINHALRNQTVLMGL